MKTGTREWSDDSANCMTGACEYQIADADEIFPAIRKDGERISTSIHTGKRLTFKGSDYSLFMIEEKNEEIGRSDFTLVCGATGTRASGTRWSIARCLEDFIKGMEKRGHISATEFKACAEALHPDYAERVRQWWKNGGPRG